MELSKLLIPKDILMKNRVDGTGFTCGSFDLLHAGHIMALREAYYGCNHLIVALQTDPTIDRPGKNKPIQSVEERTLQLKACRYVGTVLEYDTEADLYEYLKRNEHGILIRFLGADWKDKPYTGHDLDMAVRFTSRAHGLSTSELRRRIIAAGG